MTVREFSDKVCAMTGATSDQLDILECDGELVAEIKINGDLVYIAAQEGDTIVLEQV